MTKKLNKNSGNPAKRAIVFTKHEEMIPQGNSYRVYISEDNKAEVMGLYVRDGDEISTFTRLCEKCFPLHQIIRETHPNSEVVVAFVDSHEDGCFNYLPYVTEEKGLRGVSDLVQIDESLKDEVTIEMFLPRLAERGVDWTP